MPELTDDDRYVIARAAEVLAEEHGYDDTALARRIGALEYHLREVLRVARRLAGS